jgi:hypothetical protein
LIANPIETWTQSPSKNTTKINDMTAVIGGGTNGTANRANATTAVTRSAPKMLNLKLLLMPPTIPAGDGRGEADLAPRLPAGVNERTSPLGTWELERQ